jgi:transcriptional regulator with XRE-family HTH domain
MNRKIKAMLIANGIKQADIARQMGVSRGTVSGAIGGHHQSSAVKQAVAQLLGISYQKLEELWTRDPSARLKKAA